MKLLKKEKRGKDVDIFVTSEVIHFCNAALAYRRVECFEAPRVLLTLFQMEYFGGTTFLSLHYKSVQPMLSGAILCKKTTVVFVRIT